MARVDGSASAATTLPIGAWSIGFICGILFFKLVMVGLGLDMIKQDTYISNVELQTSYVPRAEFITKDQEVKRLQAEITELEGKKKERIALQKKRSAYEAQLKQLFAQGVKISKSYKATDADALEGKTWEDKTRQVLKALSRIETQFQGHSVFLGFQGNFIWYDETNPNYQHAREIIRERLNDLRHVLVILDTSVAVAD